MCLLTLFAKLKLSQTFSIYSICCYKCDETYNSYFTFKNIELYHGYVVHGALAMTDYQTWSNNCIEFSYLNTCMSIFAYYYYADIYIELLRGYHNLDTGLYIQHKGSGKLTIRAYNGHEVHVV